MFQPLETLTNNAAVSIYSMLHLPVQNQPMTGFNRWLTGR